MPGPSVYRSHLAQLGLAACLALALVGCAAPMALAERSAPQLPCQADAVQITDLHGTKSSDGPASWVAACGEQRWFCSQLHERVVCDEIPDDMPWPPADE